GYAVGWADLPAACVGAPHIRQRLWWVADADGGTQSEGRGTMPGEAVSWGSHGRFAGSGALGELADADRERRAEQHALLRSEESGRVATDLLEAPRRGELGELADTEHAERRALDIDRENGRDG